MPNDNYIQDDKAIFRARGYHVAALAMFDKGFTAEAHRKDAIDYLNRAYDVLVIEAIHYARWMALKERPRVAESDDPVNYKIENGAMISVAP